MNPPRRLLAGIGLALLSVACFATLDTAAKFASAGVPVLLALWFRYILQSLATTAAVLPTMGRAVLRTRHPWLQALRGGLLFGCSVFAFFSLQVMPVGEFTAVVMITPLVITLLAATTLGETVSLRRWALVAGGFAGTLVILRPGAGAGGMGWQLLLPLGLVVTNAGFQVLTSRLARTESPVTMHFYTGWVGTLTATLALPFVWTPVDFGWLWVALGLMGAAGSIGHYLLILAYARAPAATLTPYLYAQIGFAMLGGWLVFGHIPDSLALLGMLLVAACGAGGAWLSVHESRLLLRQGET